LAAAASVCIFYPLELVRVRLQTTRDADGEELTLQQKAHDVLLRTIRGFTERGVALRVIHSILTSFLYYRIYSWLASRGKKRTLGSNILSSNLAAMFTVLLAMPLESSVLNSQVASQNGGSDSPASTSSAERRNNAEGGGEETGLEQLQGTLQQWYQGLTPSLLLCLNPMIHYSVYDWLKLETLNWKADQQVNRASAARQEQTQHNYHRAGLYATNKQPLINRNKLTYEDLDSNQLGAGEAFIIGVIAKAVATLITFPLLRAKVLMMTSTDVRDTISNQEEDNSKARSGLAHVTTFGNSLNEEEASDDEEEDEGAAAGSSKEEVEEKIQNKNNRRKKKEKRKSPRNISEFIRRSDAGKLFDTLKLLFRVQGISGLYVGVFIHLCHTTLRGAVSMTLKEQLVQFLRRVAANGP
jgi:hypothetical protein